MTLYRTSLRLATDQPGVPARKWSNTFFVEAPTAFSAAALIYSAAWSELRTSVKERVYAYEVYATDSNTATDDFAIFPIPIGERRGTVPVAGLGEPYLPKVCLAVTLSVAGSRPSRKFWRPGLFENEVLAGVSVTPALITEITGRFNTFIADMDGALRDPDGQSVGPVQKITLTTREFGREATADVPLPPALG